MKITIYCETCNDHFFQEVDSISDIDWVCPECKSKDQTFIFEIDNPDANNEPLVMGRGGCGKCG